MKKALIVILLLVSAGCSREEDDLIYTPPKPDNENPGGYLPLSFVFWLTYEINVYTDTTYTITWYGLAWVTNESSNRFPAPELRLYPTLTLYEMPSGTEWDLIDSTNQTAYAEGVFGKFKYPKIDGVVHPKNWVDAYETTGAYVKITNYTYYINSGNSVYYMFGFKLRTLDGREYPVSMEKGVINYENYTLQVDSR